MSGFLAGLNDAKRGVAGFSYNLSQMVTGVSAQVTNGMQVLTRLDLTQITLQQSAERVHAAQQKYNQSLKQFGSEAEQTIQAQRELNRAQSDAEKTNTRARASYVLAGAEIATMAFQLPKATVDLIRFGHAAVAAGRGMTTFQIAATGGIAAVGLLAGLFVMSKAITDVGNVSAQTSTQLETLRKREAELVREMESDSLSHKMNAFQDEVLRGKDLSEQLVGVRRRIFEEEERIRKERGTALSEFTTQESLRVAIIQRDEATVRKTLEESLARAQDYRLELQQPLDLTTRAQTKELYDQELESIKNLSGVLSEWRSDEDRAAAESVAAAEAVEQAWQATMSGLQQGAQTALAGAGVSLSAFSQGFQENVLRAAGVSDQFIASLRPAVEFETLLANSSVEAARALRDQAAITAHKDETTAAFNERLKALGFTEEEIALRVDETGRALRAQAAATMQAAAASSALDSASRRRSDPLAALLEASKTDIIKTLQPRAAQPHNATMLRFLEARFDPDSLARTLRGNEMGTAVDDIFAGGIGSAQRSQLIDAVKNATMGGLPASEWDQILKAIGLRGVPAFAHGFDGLVRGPSLFMAGEHGPERVTVTPTAHGNGRGGGGVTINGGIHVHASDRRGGEEAADAIMRRLRRLGVNG